jgi:hypothetical protein
MLHFMCHVCIDRQRIAMKVAARKTAQGYLVSDERCKLCEMPLLSMNDNVVCKVCPAIRKWAQRKSDVGVSTNGVDACGATETVQKRAESHDDKLGEKDGTSEIIQSLCRVELVKTESVNDSISEKREVAEANIVKDDGVDVEATEAEEEEELFTESIEMPTFRMR